MGRIKGKIYPESWYCGPDPVDHKLYYDCQRARAQAWFRGEEWFITEKEYIEIWRKDDRYKLKGRTTGSLCLVRLDIEKAWTLDNVEVLERYKHFRRAGKERHRVEQ